MVMNGRKRTSQFINVKFKASAADYGNTEGRLNSGEEDLVAFISFFVCLQCGIRFLIYIYWLVGLCGTFDDDKTNDLMKRDGTLYGGREKQPSEFSKTWR